MDVIYSFSSSFTMKNLSHKSSINIPHWALGLLLLLFFCAPAYASDAPAIPTFRSTSPFGINQTIQGATVNNNGIHQGTIYKPFSDEHPTAGFNPSYNLGNGNNDDDDDIGIPGWADTPSEPLPIGDTAPLFLFAAAMIAIISIKQRKQQRLISQTQPTNNNNTTQHMTTRKQTYQSLRQKLFLLLAFVCLAGQVSADKTIYFRPGTRNFSIGYQTKDQANKQTESSTDNTKNTAIGRYTDIHWIKNSRIAYKVTGHSSKEDIKSKAHQTIVRDSVQSGKQSRFLPITIPRK